MTADMLQMLIPITAILVVFGFPVALVFTFKWFKLKEKELQLEAEMRKSAAGALEARVQRLESVILALDGELRTKIGALPPPRELMQAPPDKAAEQPGPTMEPPARVR